MASIQTSISLFDGVTGPLKNMHRAMGSLLDSFESVQRASGRAVDTENIRRAREEWSRAGAAFRQMEENIQDADQHQRRFNQGVRDGTSAADGLLGKVRGIAAAVGGLTAVKKLGELSDSMTSNRARLSMIVDDGGTVAQLEEKIKASAQRSRAAYLTTAQAVSQMGLMAGDAFGSNDELIAFVETLNKQFVIAGTSAQGAEAATLQLTQAMASGVLRGEELNSVFENAPNVIQAVADYMNVPIGQIRTMAAEGQLTADIVKNALLAASDSVNAQFESMPLTWAQVFTMAGNLALTALEPLLNFINWLANNIAVLGPLVLGVGAAFVVFQVAAHWTQIAAAATAVYHGVVTFLSIAYGMLTGSTTAASAAMATFNSVMLANPITWVVMLIVVLIGILYAAVAAYNKFTDSGVSATGIVGAAFAVLGAFLLNSFVVPIQNAFASLANFVGNVFHNPVAAVKVLFYDMCLTVLGYLQRLAQGIQDLLNKIPGVEVSITGGLDNLYSNLQTAQQNVKDASGWKEYVGKMNYLDYSKAASAGYNLGTRVRDKVTGVFGGLSGAGADLSAVTSSVPAYNGGAGETLDKVKANTDAIADSTAKAADALDLGAAELQLLRDIAERESINRFTTAEIKVEMTNHNTVSGTDDLDGIILQLEKRVEEAMIEVSEGVHI